MSTESTPTSVGLDALRRAVEILGLTGVASACGRPYQTVQQWLDPKRKSATPAEFCPSIERATSNEGKPVRCEELRPDVDWSVLRDPPPLASATAGQQDAGGGPKDEPQATGASRTAARSDQAVGAVTEGA